MVLNFTTILPPIFFNRKRFTAQFTLNVNNSFHQRTLLFKFEELINDKSNKKSIVNVFFLQA